MLPKNWNNSYGLKCFLSVEFFSFVFNVLKVCFCSCWRFSIDSGLFSLILPSRNNHLLLATVLSMHFMHAFIVFYSSLEFLWLLKLIEMPRMYLREREEIGHVCGNYCPLIIIISKYLWIKFSSYCICWSGGQWYFADYCLKFIISSFKNCFGLLWVSICHLNIFYFCLIFRIKKYVLANSSSILHCVLCAIGSVDYR